MLGVKIYNLNQLRKRGYHFIEDFKGNEMRVINREGKLLYQIELNHSAQLDLMNQDGELMETCKTVKFSLGRFDQIKVATYSTK